MNDNDETEPHGSGPMAMGMEMAKKMMTQMGAGSPNPMAMMQKMMKRMSADAGQAAPMSAT